MCPRKAPDKDSSVQTWTLSSSLELSEPVRRIQELLQRIDAFIEEAPPDTGPRRFGNIAFRKWYEILEERVPNLLKEYLPAEVLRFGGSSTDEVSVLDELTPYLLGGFGSAQRLDYGTGHELSFLAFLGCIWKLGGFTKEFSSDGNLERSIVLGIIEPYLRVVRRLILTYTLEPAGSHGVWGLDDHSFLPYIFGSAQFCPAIADEDPMPLEGSLPDSPNPGDIVKKNIVERERKQNMYFSAVGFINDVKTGPFWEHSPILFDISGVRFGWGKINKGMIKMYNAEVLSKFPVVQHFPFGSLFNWERDPSAVPASHTVHTANQPSTTSSSQGAPTARPLPQESTKAPWATQPATAAPWAKQPSDSPTSAGALPPTRAPWANNMIANHGPARAGPPVQPGGPVDSPRREGPAKQQQGNMDQATRAPWANNNTPPPPPQADIDGPTKAPWAKR